MWGRKISGNAFFQQNISFSHVFIDQNFLFFLHVPLGAKKKKRKPDEGLRIKHYYIFPVLILILFTLYLSISPVCKSFMIHLRKKQITLVKMSSLPVTLFFSHFYILVHIQNVSIHIFVMVGFMSFYKAQKCFYHRTMSCICELDFWGLSLDFFPDNKIKVCSRL